ncbi:MAG TPA: citrate synthase [Polyangiaceae bacterium]|jgi:citrate synthase|nr:citrate synthase [Polyangiaceae bacterium]
MNNEGLSSSSQPDAKASGLEGVLFADTRLSQVDGEHGELIIAGTRAETLAESVEFEIVAARLLELGTDVPEPDLSARLARARVAAYAAVPALSDSLRIPDAMDALLAAIAQARTGRDPISVLAALPVYVAAGARLRAGLPAIAPSATRRHAEDFLAMLDLPTDAARARALNVYLVTVSDHGLNASTFAARVVASTGSDVVSSIVAALGALKGPLHGGAPGPVLDMLDATQDTEPRIWLESELAAGRRIMGMGHRIYRVRDPRAFVFERALVRLERQLASEQGGSAVTAIMQRLAQARRVEHAAETLLSERHPERPLRANVEFYTALLLEALGIPRALFSATFAVGRCAGWLAHVAEQRRTGKLVRPSARYVGPRPAPRLE